MINHQKSGGGKAFQVINIKNISKINEQNKEEVNEIKILVLSKFKENEHNSSRKFTNRAQVNAAACLTF